MKRKRNPGSTLSAIPCRMVTYRRARVPGASYFFTATLRDRRWN
jgi:hypothetical protein